MPGSNFHGFCSYPHGGWVMVGLIGSSIGALCSTMWGVSSCRYAFVDFDSDRGDFSEFYLDPTPDGEPVQFRAGVGLFTWLEPFDTIDWSQGSCSGYTEYQTELFGDTIFEVARIFAVLSVLTGIGVVGWTLFLSCISLGKYQIWAMSTIFAIEAIFVSLTMLIFASSLCNDELVGRLNNDSFQAGCTLDQGGLVVIAAVLLWCVSFLISVMYVKPPNQDMTIRNGQITNAFEQRRKERKLHQLLAQQRREQMSLRSKHRSNSGDYNDYNDYNNDDDDNDLMDDVTEEPSSHRGSSRKNKNTESSPKSPSSSSSRKSWFFGSKSNRDADDGDDDGHNTSRQVAKKRIEVNDSGEAEIQLHGNGGGATGEI